MGFHPGRTRSSLPHRPSYRRRAIAESWRRRSDRPPSPPPWRALGDSRLAVPIGGVIGRPPETSGNGRTYTSRCPDSSDSYASHRPSGEMSAFISLYAVCISGSTPRSLVSDMEARSEAEGPAPSGARPRTTTTTRAPSGETACGMLIAWGLELSSRSTTPVPSAACQTREPLRSGSVDAANNSRRPLHGASPPAHGRHADA
jgi:hypothetical protein